MSGSGGVYGKKKKGLVTFAIVSHGKTLTRAVPDKEGTRAMQLVPIGVVASVLSTH